MEPAIILCFLIDIFNEIICIKYHSYSFHSYSCHSIYNTHITHLYNITIKIAQQRMICLNVNVE